MFEVGARGSVWRGGSGALIGEGDRLDRYFVLDVSLGDEERSRRAFGSPDMSAIVEPHFGAENALLPSSYRFPSLKIRSDAIDLDKNDTQPRSINTYSPIHMSF